MFWQVLDKPLSAAESNPASRLPSLLPLLSLKNFLGPAILPI